MVRSGGPATILIVEDECIIAMELQVRLEGFGYNVPVIVSTGEEAVGQATVSCPDLVLMDITLKGDMDGVEAADIIREKCGVPVVFLTANADEQTMQRAKITGPFGYLFKPFEERMLYATIEMALYKASAQKQLHAYSKELEKGVQERDRLIFDLKEALDKVKVLSGLLPICAYCKQIRDDAGYWSQIESYISRHSDAEFSHGICPDCVKKHFPDFGV